MINQVELLKVYRDSVNRNSDLGSSVLGYKLMVYDKQIVPQPFQGSGGCYNVYQDVIDYLVSTGLDRKEMYITNGRMD